MRGTVAKRLRAKARRLTRGSLAASSLRKHLRGTTFAHGDQTTRAMYLQLKREYKQGAR